MVNQKDLVRSIVEDMRPLYEESPKRPITTWEVKAVLDSARELILATINDDDVRLFRDLVISKTMKSEKSGRNPQTGEKIVIPAHGSPKAKFGKAFKEAVK